MADLEEWRVSFRGRIEEWRFSRTRSNEKHFSTAGTALEGMSSRYWRLAVRETFNGLAPTSNYGTFEGQGTRRFLTGSADSDGDDDSSDVPSISQDDDDGPGPHPGSPRTFVQPADLLPDAAAAVSP